jgi:hypothetical protein
LTPHILCSGEGELLENGVSAGTEIERAQGGFSAAGSGESSTISVSRICFLQSSSFISEFKFSEDGGFAMLVLSVKVNFRFGSYDVGRKCGVRNEKGFLFMVWSGREKGKSGAWMMNHAP